MRKANSRKWPAFVLPLVSLAVLLVSVVAAEAQASGWAVPRKFVEVGEGGWVQVPDLICDSGGNVHAFWSASLAADEPMALYYSFWEGTTWSEPVDVLLSPDGGNIWPVSLEADQDDYVHAFWVSSANIWHSMAHASQLGDAHSWTRPQLVPAAYPAAPPIDVAQDDHGTLFLVYSDQNQDRISVLQSTDGAATWSMETVAYFEIRPDTWASYPGILVAPDGALWAWWEELDPQGWGTGHKAFAYARSTDDGRTWSEPEQMTSGYYSGRFEAIGEVVVKLVGGGVGTGGRYISFSYDSGASWTEPRDISSGAGDGMQEIDLVVDGASTWHFVEQTAGTFATVAWDGEAWSPLELIVPGWFLGERTENTVGAISEGNRMHVFYEESDRVLWYASRLLDAPYVPPHPPQPIAATDQEPASEPTLASEVGPPPTGAPTTATPRLADGYETNPGPEDSSQWLPVVMGVLPAALIVGTFLAIWASRGRSYG